MVEITCPVTTETKEKILLGHGSGGKLTSRLIEELFLYEFGSPEGIMHDSACLSLEGANLAFTTDSYVVNPLIFPGGDIGSLAIHGTVNDLAMSGATPLWISCGFIIEEGFSMETLRQITKSMQKAAEAAEVKIVTGDTKVVERGKGDGLYLNTSGIGVIHGKPLRPEQIEVGDILVINGDIGRHGTAILSCREGLTFETTIESDSQELSTLVKKMKRVEGLHCLRDLTRGGLATVLVELAEAIKQNIAIEETSVLVDPAVRGATEFLGLDPLYVACEGRLVAFVSPSSLDELMEIMKENGENPQIIGKVLENQRGLVTAKTCIGTDRLLDKLTGDQLPRIC